MSRIDIAELRERLARQSGPEYWRSLDELAASEDFEAFLHAEFPGPAAGLTDGVDRRQFLQLMAASLALAGLGACTRQPEEKIVPAVRFPEDVPGKALEFATAMPLGGYGIGLLVESHEGRPTKIEGNPQHPASLGGTDVYAQASVLTMYDPDRAQVIRHVNDIVPFARFSEALTAALGAQEASQGAGIRILTGTVTSPTLAAQLSAFKERFPRATWHQYEPVNRSAEHAGAELAFGEVVDVLHHFDRADVVLSLDSDFLASGPDRLRNVRELMRRRRPAPEKTPNRVYMVESSYTITGSIADDRLPLPAGQIEAVARAVASRLGVSVGAAPEMDGLAPWIDAVAEDLRQARGRSIVIAGEGQPPAVHALAHAMNDVLGNARRTVDHIEPVEVEPVDQIKSLRSLTEAMRAGDVSLLLLFDANPVYDAPADLAFEEALRNVRLSMSLGLYDDETARLCHWHVPAAHYLESWGDVRSGDGTVSILQPLIAPLYEGKTTHEILALALGRPLSTYEIVREYWKARVGEAGFEPAWERWLHDGVVPDTSSRRRAVRASTNLASLFAETVASEGVEVVFRAHPTVFDGRFANNGWLQECPTPLAKLTWDNAVLVAPLTAERLGVANGDVVEVSHGGRSVRGSAWVLPGLPVDSITLNLGYGRSRAGKVGTGRGFDVYRLRTSDAPSFVSGATVQKTGEWAKLATTQHHSSMEGRHLVRTATVEQYRRDPEFAQKVDPVPPLDMTLYPNFPYEGQAWGMAIDTGACIGCNACLVACVSENNIPVVGKDQVQNGREMHWIRIDRYWTGELDNPETHYQPMLCQHCERAPCEVVCPVNATVHDGEGLNLMVYNRCVGTRYCSNNCPYKVRRFNFYLYSDWTTESLKLMRNPDVTVRSRGVMEKCTYCIQRINQARNTARKENRKVRDGEIVTACQQACPAEAIVFGDINDPESRVAKAKADSRNYSVLAELNTRPRTTYLASVRNPNPALGGGKEDEHS